jgi:hypothetical protein
MATQPTLNAYENPFDRPLQSELQEHQAAQKQTVAASPINNPFDEPLASEKAEAAHKAATESHATVAVPDAGRIPGVFSFGNKVTPKQAMGGIAAGAVAGAAPLTVEALGAAAPAAAETGAETTPGLINSAGEPIVQTTGTELKEFADNYPMLSKLATSLGHKLAGASGTYGAWELYKHITGKK